jgi:hypothetical protein
LTKNVVIVKHGGIFEQTGFHTTKDKYQKPELALCKEATN